jgi:hypothetical protein
MSRFDIIFGTLGIDCHRYLETHVESNSNNQFKPTETCSAILIHYLASSGADIFVQYVCFRKFRANYKSNLIHSAQCYQDECLIQQQEDQTNTKDNIPPIEEATESKPYGLRIF